MGKGGRMIKKIFSIVLMTGLILLTYNNCSKVAFEEAELAPSSILGTGFEESAPDVTDEDLLQALPEEEQDIYRPISDLTEDSNLFLVFKCPASDGVLICHFPGNVESAHTLCVGVNAVKSHQKHEADISESGELLGLSDYLGPCKH